MGKPRSRRKLDIRAHAHPSGRQVEPFGVTACRPACRGTNQALDLIVSEAPLITGTSMARQGGRRKYEGDARSPSSAIKSLQRRCSTSWGLLLLEEGTALKKSTRRDEQPFKTLLSSQLAPRLGGSWDLTLERKPVGRYRADLYDLRNRIVHGGYQPHDGDAEKASAHISTLSTSLTKASREGKAYPATLSAKLGEGSRGALGPSRCAGDAEAAGMLGKLLQESRRFCGS